MADLKKISTSNLKAIQKHLGGLDSYLDKVAYGIEWAPGIKDVHESSGKVIRMQDSVQGELRRRAPGKKFKVTFPNDSVTNTPDDLRNAQEFGVEVSQGKKNTSFVGSKKNLKGYFGSYGSELYPSNFKEYRTKRQAKHIERAKKVKKGI